MIVGFFLIKNRVIKKKNYIYLNIDYRRLVETKGVVIVQEHWDKEKKKFAIELFGW